MSRKRIDYNDVVIIVGSYGSGKTEIAVNLAVHQKQLGKRVKVADLDLVNPYFRTREARSQLQAVGIDVVLPPSEYRVADLPILSPKVAALIKEENQLAILDAGGNDVGATVLGALAEPLKNRPVRMLQVINPFRPYTDTAAGCLKIRGEIEHASRMPVSGIISNANLMDETQTSHILEGYSFAKAVAREGRLPLEFLTVAEKLKSELDMQQFSCPVLIISRQLMPPWKATEAFAAARGGSDAIAE